MADAAFLKALPGKLGEAVEELQLKGNAELMVKHLVVLTPPDGTRVAPPEPFPVGTPAAPMGTPLNELKVRAQAPGSFGPVPTDSVVYWDAEVRLTGASFDTGVTWDQVFGGIACRGRFEGNHMGLLRGAVWFDRAVIAKQPVTRISARLIWQNLKSAR